MQFLSLTRKICKTETDDVSTKANFPTRRQAQSSTKSRQILQRPSQRNENREWKAICKECVKSSTYTELYQRENELQCDFNAQEMETKPEQIKDILVIKKKFEY